MLLLINSHVNHVFIYTHMKTTYLSLYPANMNSIGEMCHRLGNNFQNLFAGIHWATG